MISSVKLLNAFAVLIETLWNVKPNTNSMSVANDLVLIETLWNVKGLDVFTPADVMMY